MKINRSKYLLRKLQSKLRSVEGMSKQQIFQLIKPNLVEEFETYLSMINVSTGLKKTSSTNRGRPRTYNLYDFFDIVFKWLDNGFKSTFIREEYKDAGGGSFFRYFELLCQSKIIFKLWKISSLTADKSKLFIIDSFIVKSIEGTEGTGENCFDRRRRGTKVTLIANKEKIITNILITPANKAEVECLKQLLEEREFTKPSTLLSDRGYYSGPLINACKEQKIKLLMWPKKLSTKKKIKTRKFLCKGCKANTGCTAPKRCSNDSDYLKKVEEESKVKMSHTLTRREKVLINKNRNKIEHVNGEIRRFRAANLKCVRKIKYYQLLITLGALLVNIFHNGFV